MNAERDNTRYLGTLDEPDADGLERGILWVLAAFAGLMGLLGLISQSAVIVVRYTLAGSPLRADAVIAGAVATARESWEMVQDEVLVGLWFELGLWILLVFFLALVLRFDANFGFAARGYQTPWGRALGPTLAMGAGVVGLLGVIGTVATIGYLLDGAEPGSFWSIGPVVGAATLWPAYTVVLIAGAYLLIGGGLWLFRRFTVASMPDPRRSSIRHPTDTDAVGVIRTPPITEPGREPRRRLGICSSGGGLRSASFSLGAYQVLDEAREFQRARYLSAVSGGAYIAGGMTTVDGNLTRGERLQAGPFAPRSPEERHLRRNSYYLAPTFLAKLGMVGRLLLGLMFSIVLIGAVLTATARPWGAFMSSSVLYPELNGVVDAVAVAAGDIESAAGSVATRAVEEPLGPPTRFVDEALNMRDGAAALLAAHEAWGESFEQASLVASVLVVRYDETRNSESLADVVRVSGELTLLDVETRGVAAAANDLALQIRELGDEATLEETAELAVGAAALAGRAEGLTDLAGRLSKPSLPVPGGWAAIAVALLVALVVGMISVGSQRVNDRTSWRRRLQRTSVLMLIVALALFLTLVTVPWLLTRGTDWVLKQGTEVFAALQGIGAAILAVGAVRTIVAKRASILGTIAGGVVAPLMVILAVLAIARAGAEAGDVVGGWAWVFAALALLIVASLLADLNAWSMHPFYRRKLESAFLRERDGDETRPLSAEERRLSHYLARRTYNPISPDFRSAPELIIGAAANITQVGATPSGRNAVSFTFSPTELRADGLGRVPTLQAERTLGARTAESISLPSAVAISGAAVSPAMGKMTRRPLQALLALANVRLGVWMPNPAWLHAFMEEREIVTERLDSQIAACDAQLEARQEHHRFAPGRVYHHSVKDQAVRRRRRTAVRQWKDRVRPTYLVKEIFGIYRPWDRYLYVTDGGHWENLGVVELLRRGCTEIYCLDAAGGSPDQFKTLSEAITLARTELGIRWGTIDLAEMRARSLDDGPPREEDKGKRATKADPVVLRSPRDHLPIEFEYPDGTPGVIVYCRATVTEDAPIDLRAYQRENPIFPAHSTLDQFFDYEQLEAYRMLGWHVARNAVATMNRTPSRGASSPRSRSTGPPSSGTTRST